MYMHTLITLLFVSNVVYASNDCNIKGIADLYNRVKDSGPTLFEAKKKKEAISTRVSIAEQRPNPEVDFEYMKGDEFGIDINTYTVSAMHVFEYGSKREKRIAKAKSYQSLKNAQVDLSLYKSNIDAAILFQRVAQLNVTIESVKEAINAFGKIIKKLSSRARLNPEETVSLSTLRLAINDYKAQLNDLENERTLSQGSIAFLSSCDSIQPLYKDLNYYKLPEAPHEVDDKKLSLLKLEDFKVTLAENELEIQKSLGYSDISIGPTLEYKGQGNDEFTSAGVAVSFSLPFFHTNDGGKLEALKKVSMQKMVTANRKRMLTIKRDNLITKFNRSLGILMKMPKLDELNRKHDRVEKLFLRGVVSISMTIESHRQQIDFLKSRFETENDVLETLGMISLIDGDNAEFEKLLTK